MASIGEGTWVGSMRGRRPKIGQFWIDTRGLLMQYPYNRALPSVGVVEYG